MLVTLWALITILRDKLEKFPTGKMQPVVIILHHHVPVFHRLISSKLIFYFVWVFTMFKPHITENDSLIDFFWSVLL